MIGNRIVIAFCVLFLSSLVGFVIAGLAYAAPSSCMFPGTTGRAVKTLGNGPDACAMNICRSVDKITTKLVPCNSGPACAIGAFYVEQWKAASGAWGGLPACPSWTNTSTWN